MFQTWKCSSERIEFTSPPINSKGWLLLTFFVSLHNQLSSFNSFIEQMFEKRVHQREQIPMACKNFTTEMRTEPIL